MSIAAKRVLVLIPNDVHLLDLSGPAQVFYETTSVGGAYELVYCAPTREVTSAQGLVFGNLRPLPEPLVGDIVLVPGVESRTLDTMQHVPVDWLRAASAAKSRIASVCSGAFLLARAGLLAGRDCTTHFKLVKKLQAEVPSARVHDNRLYVEDTRDEAPVTTSAGVASGIDMALAMVEHDFGPQMVGRVAREMVIYLRRSGDSGQRSIYLEHRTHMHAGVHRVQDWITAHPDSDATLEGLSSIAVMSPRNLTRVFRRETGISLKDFQTRIRLQVASDLMQQTDIPLDHVAARCGFKDARSLRRLFSQAVGAAPSVWRRQARG